MRRYFVATLGALAKFSSIPLQAGTLCCDQRQRERPGHIWRPLPNDPVITITAVSVGPDARRGQSRGATAVSRRVKLIDSSILDTQVTTRPAAGWSLRLMARRDIGSSFPHCLRSRPQVSFHPIVARSAVADRYISFLWKAGPYVDSPERIDVRRQVHWQVRRRLRFGISDDRLQHVPQIRT